MKEASFLTDHDYLKTKNQVGGKCSCSMATTTLSKKELEMIEREKDRKFQILFHELWPHIHSRVDEPTTAQKLAAEVEKNKKMQEMLIEQELKKFKEEEKKKQPPLPSIYSSIYSPRCSDAMNISINGLCKGN